MAMGFRGRGFWNLLKQALMGDGGEVFFVSNKLLFNYKINIEIAFSPLN
jgi:hypothetical protein